MNLSSDLISQFAKLTSPKTNEKKESTVYGTIVEYGGSNYVQFDGSELLTPVMTTVEAKPGDRVTVLLKNHTATVTGNITSPAARVETVANIEGDILEVQTLLGGYVKTEELTATNARISDIEADNATINDALVANSADITELQTTKLSAKDIDGKFANIDFSNISRATMEYFYSHSGLIKNVTVGEGTITGNLVGVTITGDLIQGNTVKADKLVIKGTDGLYYKLNTDGMKTEAEQTDENSLNGSVITARSITASKINVDDLVAFDATIGGFNITSDSLYSGVKSSIDNTASGIYMDKYGQMSLGDGNNFIRYYRDQNEEYHLEISAQSVVTSVSAVSELDEPQTKNLETMLVEIQETAESAVTTSEEAAKTATNYLGFSSSGLVVGDMTASNLGKNVLIDSDSVDIRNGTTTLASFGASKVTLGRNAEDSVIDLCNGAGRISANTSEAATSFPHRNAILIDSQEIETESLRFVASTSNAYGASSTPTVQRGTELYMLRSSGSAESCARLKAEHKTTSSGAYTSSGVSAMTYDEASKTRLLAFASDSANGTYNQVNLYPTKTTMNKPLVLNGITHTGKNKILWSGEYYLSETQTATLSEAISAQPHGIVLVWSYYKDGASDNSAFNPFFIPKQFVASHAGKGISMFLTTGTMGTVATKYAYISDTSIKGHANNNDGATAKSCGITSTPSSFALRYVIGV